MACLITGISPQEAVQKGVVETEFAQRIPDEMSRPGTCSAGYNSIRFDDVVTRHLLYRNLRDAYEREYRNGNSRWDLINRASPVSGSRTLVEPTRSSTRAHMMHWPTFRQPSAWPA